MDAGRHSIPPGLRDTRPWGPPGPPEVPLDNSRNDAGFKIQLRASMQFLTQHEILILLF